MPLFLSSKRISAKQKKCLCVDESMTTLSTQNFSCGQIFLFLKLDLCFFRMVDSLDLNVCIFDTFGKSVIKQFGISPDAFFQVALQLAMFRWDIRNSRFPISKYHSRKCQINRLNMIKQACITLINSHPHFSWICYNRDTVIL